MSPQLAVEVIMRDFGRHVSMNEWQNLLPVAKCYDGGASQAPHIQTMLSSLVTRACAHSILPSPSHRNLANGGRLSAGALGERRP